MCGCGGVCGNTLVMIILVGANTIPPPITVMFAPNLPEESDPLHPVVVAHVLCDKPLLSVQRLRKSYSTSGSHTPGSCCNSLLESCHWSHSYPVDTRTDSDRIQLVLTPGLVHKLSTYMLLPGDLFHLLHVM